MKRSTRKRVYRGKQNLADNIVLEQTEEEYEYQYHLGDKVYIGADEYEILNIGDLNIVLYDYQYPLFNREMSKEEFDKKVKENPANDHLKVKISNIQEKNTKKIMLKNIRKRNKKKRLLKET